MRQDNDKIKKSHTVNVKAVLTGVYVLLLKIAFPEKIKITSVAIL